MPRFVVGFVFVFSLSLLMALTDVSPLFKVIGLDINASPVALGVGIAVLLNISINPKASSDPEKEDKVKDIQVKANEIIKTSADIGTGAG